MPINTPTQKPNCRANSFWRSNAYPVDVYTNNETLEKYLDQLAWAGYSGGMAVKIGTAVVTSGLAGAALSAAGSTDLLEEIIRDTSPGDLREMIRDQLREQGIGQDLINLFLRNPEFSPRHQAAITSALAKLEGVSGKKYWIRRAANAKS